MCAQLKDLFKAPQVFFRQSAGSPLAHIFVGRDWFYGWRNDFAPFGMHK
jgi:hypothetical protein